MEPAESHRLQALWELNILESDAEPAFGRLADVVGEILGVPYVYIDFVGEDRQWTKTGPSGPGREISREVCFGAYVVEQGDVFEVVDARGDDRFANNPRVCDEPGIRFYAGAPLVLNGSCRIGALGIADTKPRSLLDRDRGRLQKFADLVVELLDMRQESVHGQFLTTALEEAREPVLITEGEPIDPPGPKIIWVNDAFCQLTGYSPGELIGANPRILQGPETSRQELDNVRRALEVGKSVRAETINYRKDDTPYIVEWTIVPVETDGGEISHWVSIQRNVTEQRKREDALIREARQDPLTGIANRTAFVEHLNKRLTEGLSDVLEGQAVVYLDLDRFKYVNDSYGHKVGDELLIEVSRRLDSVLREDDMVARFGGDEFAILIGNCPQPETADTIVGRIQGELERPIEIEGRSIFMTASVGILHDLKAYDDPETVVQHADVAMYSAKQKGRRKAVHFDEPLYDTFRRQVELEGEIRKGIDDEQFIPFYQPVFDLREGTLAGFEALARWNHPTRGILGPGTFLEAASAAGLMLDVGEQVMGGALDQVRVWDRKGWNDLLLVLSVNFSQEELMRSNILDNLSERMAACNLEPGRFMLEVTERALGTDPGEVASRIQELVDRDFKVALDDFGTGYTSLNAIHSFPISHVKLDRSLISGVAMDEKKKILVRTATQMAHQLDKSVVAEGVETPDQLELLRDFNCDYAQGYLFSRPVPAAEATVLLEDAGSVLEHFSEG